MVGGMSKQPPTPAVVDPLTGSHVSLSQLLAEPPVSLLALAKKLDVHVATPQRWSQRGCRGHVLQTYLRGSRRYTSIPAYERWVAAINGEPAAASQTPRQRELAIDRAEQEAEALGV